MVKNDFKKKVVRIIVIILCIFILFSLLATKIVCDITFRRYDTVTDIPYQLTNLVAKRLNFKFDVSDSQLQGYFYVNESSESLIVLVTGYRATADDYLWQISELYEKGYSVITFDAFGHGKSGGDSSVGFSQSTYDLQALLDIITENKNFGHKNLYLIGHSRGALAVCSLMDSYKINAAVTVSGVNGSMDAIMQPVKDTIGNISYINYPFLWLYQSSLFGAGLIETDAAQEIEKSGVPTLVVQGSEDDIYSVNRYSVYSFCKKRNIENAKYYLCENDGQNGHTNLLFDSDGTANNALIEEIDSFFFENREVEEIQ